MITNKDIRVENGSLIINGDPYPLDGQSPEAIMQIVKDNSDTTPTENSDAPITSGGVYTALGAKQDTLTFDNAPTASSTKPVTSGGIYTALNTIDTAKADVFKSQSPDVSQSINVGILVASANRMFLLSSGYQGRYVFGLVFISSTKTIEYVDISHKDATVSSISYNDGVVSITFSNPTYTPASLIRLC